MKTTVRYGNRVATTATFGPIAGGFIAIITAPFILAGLLLVILAYAVVELVGLIIGRHT